jgi:hypothetical protein
MRVPSVHRVGVFIGNRAGRWVPNTVILRLPATFPEYFPQQGHYGVVRYSNLNIHEARMYHTKGSEVCPHCGRAGPRPQDNLAWPSLASHSLDFVGALTSLAREELSLQDAWRKRQRAPSSCVALCSAYFEGHGQGPRCWYGSTSPFDVDPALKHG